MKRLLAVVLMLVLTFTFAAYASNATGCAIVEESFSDSTKDYYLGKASFSGPYSGDLDHVAFFYSYTDKAFFIMCKDYAVLWNNVPLDKAVLACTLLCGAWDIIIGLFDQPIAIGLMLSDSADDGIYIDSKSRADSFLETVSSVLG